MKIKLVRECSICGVVFEVKTAKVYFEASTPGSDPLTDWYFAITNCPMCNCRNILEYLPIDKIEVLYDPT